jgi:hypothetical protein
MAEEEEVEAEVEGINIDSAHSLTSSAILAFIYYHIIIN